MSKRWSSENNRANVMSLALQQWRSQCDPNDNNVAMTTASMSNKLPPTLTPDKSM
jgi:hypothetical protein